MDVKMILFDKTHKFIKECTQITNDCGDNYDVLYVNSTTLVVFFVYRIAELHKVYINNEDDLQKILDICREIDEEIFR